MAAEIASRSVFSLGITPSDGTLWTNRDVQYEWAIGGQPFLSIASDEYQSLRGFVQVNKQQFDSQQEPGEQSLTGWWLRSQRDFSAGAGLNFFEPANSNAGQNDSRTMRRFKSSYGVDVWTPGQVSLLKSMSSGASGTGKCQPVSAGSSAYYTTGSSVSVARTTTSSTTSVTSWNAVPDWIVSSGATVFAFSTSGIDRLVASTNTVTQAYTTGGVSGRGWWIKGSFLACIGSSVYRLPENPAAPPAALPTAVPVGTMPTDWTWTSACETPSSILLGGFAGAKSTIYQLIEKIDISSAGASSTTYAITTVAELPYGETVLGLYNYLGSYVAIGTNRGLRIGIMSDQGTLSYGPLVWDLGSVEHMVGKDRFIYAGVSNVIPDGTGTDKSGLIRVDLSEPDSAGRFAWAYDLSTGVTGTVNGVCPIGTSNRLVIGVEGQGSFVESASTLVSSGLLTTGQVRYSTLEPKTFQQVTVRSDSVAGRIAVSSVGAAGSVTTLYTLSGASSSAEIAMFPRTPTESMGLQFNLQRSSTDSTLGPTLRGWQLKSLPAVTRKQQWRLPFVCFDQEQDRFGNRTGTVGNAYTRYQSLRTALLTGVPVILQDLINNEQYAVLVEDVQFVQTTPPRGASGFGGVLVVQAREL